MKRKSILTLLIVTFFTFVFVPAVFAESWFDGLPRAGLSWLETQAKHPGTYISPNKRHETFGNYTIYINFVDDEELARYSEGHEDEYIYYWVKIVDNSTGQFVSGVPKKFSSQKEILSELSKALSLEDLMALEEAQRRAELAMRPFSTLDSDENKAPLVSSETPIASADRTGIRLMKTVITPIVKSEKEQLKEESGKPKFIGGTVTYEDFEYYDTDGDSYEIIAGMEQELDNFTYGFYMPLSYVDIDNGNWTKLGLTGYIKKDFYKNNFKFSYGLNCDIENTWMDVSGIDDSFAYGGGIMGAIEYTYKNINIKFGSNLLYMDNTDYDEVTILTTGINIGLPLKNNLTINAYTYRNDNFDSSNDYYIVGGTFSYMPSDTFALSFGVNTVTSYDEYDSVSYYLGSTWRF